MSKRPASQELDHDPMLFKKFFHLKLTNQNAFSSIQEIALTILENRKLAQYVEHVTLNVTSWHPTPTKALPYTATTPSEIEKETIFKAAIAEQKWEEEDATELLKRLMTTSSPGYNKPSSHTLLPDAVLGLLLPILPNVQKWTVGAYNQPLYVGKAIQRAKDGIFGSISITDVEILPDTSCSEARWGDYDFPAFKIFGNLQALKTISGKGIGGIVIEDGGTYTEIPSKASAVQEIHLKHCELSGGCLSKIIGFSTGLKAFTYGFGGRSGDGSSGVVYSPQLANALTPHKSTLQSLDIDIDDLIHQDLGDEVRSWEQDLKEQEDDAREAEEEEDENDQASQTETLNSDDGKANAKKREEATKSDPYFPNLTHLRIGIELASRFAKLSGKKTLAEWLPPKLEELEIIGYKPGKSETITEQIKEVVERKNELLPQLKTLRGVEEYIENGKELDGEDDFVASDASEVEELSEGDDAGNL